VSALLAAGQGVEFESIAKVMKEMACLHFLNIEKLYYMLMEAIHLRRAQEQEQEQAQPQAHVVGGVQAPAASAQAAGRSSMQALPQLARASLPEGVGRHGPVKSTAKPWQHHIRAKGQPGSRGAGTIDMFFQKKLTSKPREEAAEPQVTTIALTLCRSVRRVPKG
jgi:hypothetical protein